MEARRDRLATAFMAAVVLGFVALAAVGTYDALVRRAPDAGAQDAGTQDAARDGGEAEFAGAVEAALRQAGETRAIAYDARLFSLTVGEEGDGGESSRISLHNIYADYRAAAPDDRAAVLSRLATSVRNVPQLPESYEEARPRLRPAMRPRAYFESVAIERGGLRVEKKNMPLWIAVTDRLVAAVAYDSGPSMMFLSSSSLERWSVTFERAMKDAVENLRRDSEEPFEEVGPGLYASPWQDNYDASRLLLPEKLRSLAVKGRVVACVPNRDTLLVAGSDDAAALATLLDRAQEALSAPRPMDGVPRVLEGEAWRPFHAKQGTAIEQRIRVLDMDARLMDYGDQKDLLEASIEQEGTDLFVATFSAVKKEDGTLFSYCVWSEGVDALLPRADVVAFTGLGPDGGGRTLGMAPWDRVVQAAGKRMERQDFYPERFRVRSFPSPAELAKIRPEPLTAPDEPDPEPP